MSSGVWTHVVQHVMLSGGGCIVTVKVWHGLGCAPLLGHVSVASWESLKRGILPR